MENTTLVGIVKYFSGPAIAIFIEDSNDFVYLDDAHIELEKGDIITGLRYELGDQQVLVNDFVQTTVHVDDWGLSLEQIRSYGFH